MKAFAGKFEIGVIVTIIMLSSGVVSSYFTGIASSKEYTDMKISKAQDLNDKKIEQIQTDMEDMKVDVAVIKQILVQRFGSPR